MIPGRSQRRLGGRGRPELLSCVWTVQALDLTLAKDERLAVGFFQRAGVLTQMNR